MAETITGELLEDAHQKTEQVIKKNNLSVTEDTLLKNQSLILRIMLIDRKDRQARRNRALSRNEGVYLLIIALAAPEIIKFLASLF